MLLRAGGAGVRRGARNRLLGRRGRRRSFLASQPHPSRGEGIQALLGYAQYYPSVESPYFVKAGLGRATYWTNHAGESGGSGPAAMLGAGRDFAVSGKWSITAAVDYSWGRLNAITSPPGITQDERYRALTLRIGLTYR